MQNKTALSWEWLTSGHTVLSALAAACGLGTSLLLVLWYELEQIGYFGIAITLAGMLGLAANLKLHSLAPAEPTAARANGLVATSMVLSCLTGVLIYGALRVAPMLLGTTTAPWATEQFAVWIAMAASTTGLYQCSVSLLLRAERLRALGVVKVLRSIFFLLAVGYWRGGDSINLTAAFAIAPVPAVALAQVGWLRGGVLIPGRENVQRSIALVTSSAALSIFEYGKLALLSAWLAPAQLGMYYYYARVVKGAQQWPGAVHVENNIAALVQRGRQYTSTIISKLKRQVGVGIAVSAALTVCGWSTVELARDEVVGNIGWALVVLTEAALLYVVVLLRPLPIFIGRQYQQVIGETLVTVLSLAAMVACTFLLTTTWFNVAVTLILPALLAVGAYRYILIYLKANPTNQ